MLTHASADEGNVPRVTGSAHQRSEWRQVDPAIVAGVSQTEVFRLDLACPEYSRSRLLCL